jgi:hypothetical protein
MSSRQRCAGWTAISRSKSFTCGPPIIGGRRGIRKRRNRKRRQSPCRCIRRSSALFGSGTNKAPNRANGLRFSLGAQERSEAAASGDGAASQDPAGVCQDRNHRRGLAQVSSHCRLDAGRDGRTSLTSRDCLRHSHQNVTNQYLQATSNTKRLAQDKLVHAILSAESLSKGKSALIQQRCQVLNFREYRAVVGRAMRRFRRGTSFWVQINPDFFGWVL